MSVRIVTLDREIVSDPMSASVLSRTSHQAAGLSPKLSSAHDASSVWGSGSARARPWSLGRSSPHGPRFPTEKSGAATPLAKSEMPQVGRAQRVDEGGVSPREASSRLHFVRRWPHAHHFLSSF